MTASEEIITYTVRDKGGMVRTRGATLADAQTVARRVAFEADVPVSCDLERVTHRSETTRETIANYPAGGSAERVAAGSEAEGEAPGGNT
jgi:hypothetical protein